jgi:hypothetical protein
LHPVRYSGGHCLHLVEIVTMRVAVLGTLAIGALVLALGVPVLHAAEGAGGEACDLLPKAEVEKVIRNAVDTVTRNLPRDVDGARITSCAYYVSGGTGNSALISITTTPSPAAARERMATLAESVVKAGGTAEPDTIAARPALFTVARTGTIQMYVAKGDLLVGAGVYTRQGGYIVPLKDFSRELAAAVLAAL